MRGDQVKTFFVEMYQSVPVFVEVEAFDAEEAGEIGEEMIRNGMGRIQELNIAYHPDRTVYTDQWLVADDELF
jgi:hypothetical protein